SVSGADALEAALKQALEAGKGILRERSVVAVRLEQIHRERGDERSRKEVGREHREDDGFSEWNEEEARDAGEEEHRQEDDADAERGDERGNGDLCGAFEDGAFELAAFFEVAFDVFDGDGCIVDEDADGEREAAERHDVDGLTDEAEDDNRGEDRKRNRDCDDDGRTPGAEEEQDHQAGERGGDDGLTHDSADGGADEERLIADGRDLEARGQARLDAWQQPEHAFDDGERGRGAGLEDAEKNAAVAVLTDDVGLRNEAVGDGGNITHVDHCAVDLLDGYVGEALDGRW